MNFGPFGCDLIGKIVILAMYLAVQALIHIFILVSSMNSPTIGSIIMLLVWYVLSIVWIINYFKLSWLDAGSIQAELKTKSRRAIAFYNENVTRIDILPKCDKCGCPKSSRTHHCSVCNRCYCRFDHHCPVVGNCIAYNNIKNFVLFFFYSGLMLTVCGIYTAITVEDSFFEVASSLLLIIPALFFLGVTAATLLTVINDKTVMESNVNINITSFRSKYENFCVIFGRYPHQWFLPTNPDLLVFEWCLQEEYFNMANNVSVKNYMDPDR